MWEVFSVGLTQKFELITYRYLSSPLLPLLKVITEDRFDCIRSVVVSSKFMAHLVPMDDISGIKPMPKI